MTRQKFRRLFWASLCCASIGVLLSTPAHAIEVAEELFVGPGSGTGEGPLDTGKEAGSIIFVAGQGEFEYESQNNTIETCRVIKENGTLSEWTDQGSWGQIAEYAHDADLFFNYLFVMPGAKLSTDGYATTPEGKPSRHPVVIV